MNKYMAHLLRTTWNCPRRFGDAPPGPADLDRHGRCWWWYPAGWLLDQPLDLREPGFLWLPYSALPDPSGNLTHA